MQEDAEISGLSCRWPRGHRGPILRTRYEDARPAGSSEYWDDQATHQAFVKGAAEAGAFAPFDDLLAAPFVVAYGEPVLKTDR